MNIKKFFQVEILLTFALLLLLSGVPAAAFPMEMRTMDVSDSTQCVPDTVPFFEDYEGYQATGYNVQGVLPDCWETKYSGTNLGYQAHITMESYYSIAGKSMVVYSSSHGTIGTPNYAVLPKFVNDLNGTQISFTARRPTTDVPNDRFVLGYFDGGVDTGVFVALETYVLNTSATSYTLSLNGLNIPQGAQLAFRQEGGMGTFVFATSIIDNVAIDFLPCSPVSGVSVSEVMMTTAHVAWTPGAWESAWQVEYGVSGFTPGTGTVVTTDTVCVDLAGLDGETMYDVYVRAVCDPANLSDNSAPVSFYTYCSVQGDTSVVEVCERYEWRDSAYTESGTYYDTVARASAVFCDSIYTLQLTVHKSAYRYDTLEICQDQLPYIWYDTTFETGSVSGTFFFSDTTVFGCDSTVELALIIHPSYYEDQYDTICQNDLPYQWKDTLFLEETTTGSYVFYRHSEWGCDSVVTLHLLVNEAYDQLELLQVCSHDLPVVWRDTTFYEGTESGVFTFRRYSQHGCDSLVSLALYVTESDTVQKEDTICVSQLPYTWQDTTFEEGTVTGYYLVGGNLSTGCESTLLHLVVGGNEQDMNHPDTIRVCQKELPYVWHGNLGDYTFGTNTTRGRHRVTVNAGGCTDIYYVFVDLLPNSDVEVSETICSSQLPYTKYDTTFLAGTQSGTYYVTRPDGNGCEKTTTIHLTVNPSYVMYDTLTLCRNEIPYYWQERREWIQLGMNTGDYTYSRTTALGCDSTVYLHLIVNPSYDEVESLVVCENELPVEWRGHIIPRGTTSQDLVYEESTVTGCDSTVTLKLTVNPTYRQEVEETICSGDLPYTWRDTTFAEGTLGGTYLFEKQSTKGCDSTVVLHLTVNPTKEEYVTEDICRAELPYRWRDTVFDEGTVSGTFTFHRYTSKNCDSTVTLTLNVHEPYGANEGLVVCENELPVVWRGNIIPRGTITGNLVFNGQTAFGCDSIVVLSVVVNPAYHQNEELVICENELPYTWRDTVFEAGTRGGSFYFERQSVKGCDSTVMLKLTVNPSYYYAEELTICEQELPYVYRDTTFLAGTESGSYTLRRPTVHGCDSIFTLSLTVNPTISRSDELTLCASELPYIYGDTVFGQGTQSGTYVFRRAARTGCDSIVTLDLTVNSRGYQQKSYEICSSELPYETADTTFPTGTSTGLYNILYSTPNGCDSVVAIALTVHPDYYETVSVEICENDLPYVWRDTTFAEGTNSGVYRFARTTDFGCDSVTTLALIVHPSYDQEETAEVCADGFPFVWRDTTFLAGTESGEFVFVRQSVNGCDSVVTLHLTINPVYNQEESLEICQNELPYMWRDIVFPEGTTSGIHTYALHSSAGCDSTVTLALTVYPVSTQNYNLRICSADLPYYWDVTDTTFGVGTESGSYRFRYTNVLGCDSSVYLNLTVNPSYDILDTLRLCQNELPYPYAYAPNHYITTNMSSGDYTYTRPTAAGCDTTINLHLVIYPSYIQQESAFVCEDEFPYVWRDTTFMEGTVSGTYIFNRVSQYGCDSVVSLMLVVNTLPTVTIMTVPNGDVTMLICSSNANTFLWSTGETANMIVVPTDSVETYSVTVTNASTGCTNSASISIGVGIEENGEVLHNVIVYPNPTDGKVTVSADGEMIAEIRAYSLEGRMVKRVRVADTEAELNFDALAKGTYLLQIQLQQGDIVRKKLVVR